MIKLLPIVLLIALLVGGLAYWRYNSSKTTLISSTTEQNEVAQAPIEVPKTLPKASLEDRVKSLEDLVTKLVSEVNSLKSKSNTTITSSQTSTNNTSITELTARVAALEKSSPTSSTTTSKYPSYIPLGSSSNSWTNTDWTTVDDFQVSINTDNYPGYSSMQIEVVFRVVDPSGTGSVRLYNLTDGSSVGSQMDTTSTSFTLKSSSFTPAKGTKTYTLQIKSSAGKELYIQNARIKVSF